MNEIGLDDYEEETFEDIYEAYLGANEEYKKAHDEYILKRAQFLRFQTLKSRKDAFDATLSMLKNRDEVVIAYLKVLKASLLKGVGLADERKNELFLEIDNEISWFSNHKENLSSAGSLEDLVRDSKFAADRWSQLNSLIYEVMSVLSQGKVSHLSVRLEKIFRASKNKFESIRNEERPEYAFDTSKIELLDRWMFEAEGKIDRSKEKQDEVEKIIRGNYQKKIVGLNLYNSVLSKLSESQLYMKEASNFLKEIIKQIRTK